MKKNSNSWKKWIIIVAILVFVAIIIFLIVQALLPKETHTSSDDTTSSVGSLYCKSANPVDPFFASEKATAANHELKITLKDNRPDKMSYTYTGTFDSEETTSGVLSNMTASYNIYMGKTGIRIDELYPTFSNLGTTGIINLYLDDETFNKDTARFMFLSESDYADFDRISVNTLKSLYRTKGFTCQINE